MTGVILSIAVICGVWSGWSGSVIVGLFVLAWLGSRRVQGLTVTRRDWMVVALVTLAGIGGALRVGTVENSPVPPDFDAADRFEGRIVSVPRSDGRYQRFDVAVERARSGTSWRDVTATVSVTAPSMPAAGYGDRIGLTGSFDRATDLSPGYGRYLINQGSAGSVFAYAVWVEERGTGLRRWLFDLGGRIADSLRESVPGDAGVLLVGLVTGDDTALSAERNDRFQRTGTSHITAVSGANVGLIVAVLLTTGGLVGWKRRLLTQLLILVAVWGYAMLTGLDAPVIRAAAVATLSVMAIWVGRRPDYLTAAFLTAAGMVLLEPSHIHAVGFQLSFAASLALAATFQGADSDGGMGWAGATVSASVVAQIATLPIILISFGALPLASLPANIVIGPLVAFTFPIALLAGILGVFVPILGDALAVVAGFGAHAILGVIDVFGAPEWLAVPIPAPSGTVGLALMLVSAIAITSATVDGNRGLGRLVLARRSSLVDHGT